MSHRAMKLARHVNPWFTDGVNRELSTPSSESKPHDFPAEQERRTRALRALKSALDEEARVREEATRKTFECAQTAVWLGASLADLAGVTGHSRQAARKRWPGLGAVQRRRQWLTGHVDDILHSARLILEREDEFPLEPAAELREAVEVVTAALADTAHDTDSPAARWHLLDALVDRQLRAIADSPASETRSSQAAFAREGASGVIAHYDAVISQGDSEG